MVKVGIRTGKPRLFESRSIQDRAQADRGPRAWAWGATSLAALCLAATSAAAHGFGERYELPLPLPLYLFGGAAVVALSFVVFALFLGHRPAEHAYAKLDLTENPLARALVHPMVAIVLKLASVALFVVTILAALIGDQNPYRNLAPTLVWIVWWVGFAYVSAFLGDLWRLINPWATLFDASHWLARQLSQRRRLYREAPYPEALGAWPACALLLAFAWIELVYPTPAVPRHIGCLAIAYSLFTCSGMFLFGRAAWLENGEMFAVFFALLARLAPTEAVRDRLYLRPFGAGLRQDPSLPISKVGFVLLMLSSVLYDGLLATPQWANFEALLAGELPELGAAAPIVIRTLGLIGLWLLFVGAFLGIGAVMSAVAAHRAGVGDVVRAFALTLIPIVIGYHVAHYLVYLLIQGQYIIPLASDPFGYGWNLFGTADYRVDIALAGARFTWYLALAAIVVGHVTAVYLAHARAPAVFGASSAALRTQIPLTALMVVYTFIGLSIIAEPVVDTRAAAEPTRITAAIAVPGDAVLPDAGSGRLRPVGAGSLAKLKLSYKVLGSAFQDGTKTTAADLLYALAFAYRWGEPHGEAKQFYDPVVDAATVAIREHLIGLRIGAIDAVSKSLRIGDVNFVREVFTVETYLNVRPDDPDWSAAVAPPFSTVPWHLLALMEEAVVRGWAAFSEVEARRRGIEWLDLVRSKELAPKLATLVAQFEARAYRPDALRDYVSENAARQRWAALAAFYKDNGHFLVTNGPYRLKRWSDDSVTLDAFRDLSYPLGVGSYDVYALPRRGFITGIERSGTSLVVSGDIEVVEKFQRSHKLVRTPLKALPAVVRNRAAPECRYVLADQTGRIVLSGTATVSGNANFVIDLEGRVPPGSYTISAFIAVNGNAMNPDIYRSAVAIPR
jgi:hypothetical protein